MDAIRAAYQDVHEQQYRLWNEVYGRLEDVRERLEQLEGDARKLGRRTAALRARESPQELARLQEEVSNLNSRIDGYKAAELYLEVIFFEMVGEAETLHAKFSIAVSRQLFAQTEAMISALDAVTESSPSENPTHR